MDESEFDRFADEYRETHAANIRVSGEAPEFFAEYKVVDVARQVRRADISVSRILDFGCGVGNSTEYLCRYFPGCEVVGADVSQKSLDIARARFAGRARFARIHGASLSLQAEIGFDVLFAACVFHHIPRTEHGLWLSELRRHARPGALLIVFEHNPWNPLTVHAVNTCPFDVNAHLLTPFYLKSALARAGWRQMHHEYRIFFPGFLSALRPMERYLAALPVGAQFLVTARA